MLTLATTRSFFPFMKKHVPDRHGLCADHLSLPLAAVCAAAIAFISFVAISRVYVTERAKN
jgi:hypothetical protein